MTHPTPRTPIAAAAFALLLVLSLLPAASVLAGDLVLGDGGIVFADGSVQTTAASARHFYLSTSVHVGSTALIGCDPGFHMASLGELGSLAGLRYDTTRGETLADAGAGPPFLVGWMRTGTTASSDNVPGRGNCDAWTTNSAAASGTRAALTPFQASTVAPGTQWLLSVLSCNTFARVWCIED